MVATAAMNSKAVASKVVTYAKPIKHQMIHTWGVIKAKTEASVVAPVVNFVKSMFN